MLSPLAAATPAVWVWLVSLVWRLHVSAAADAFHVAPWRYAGPILVCTAAAICTRAAQLRALPAAARAAAAALAGGLAGATRGEISAPTRGARQVWLPRHAQVTVTARPRSAPS